MTTQEIEKLKKVDEIMFNLQDSVDPLKKLLQAGKLLKELKLIDNPTDTDEIIQAYTQNVYEQLNKIIERKNVSFNQATLDYLQKDPDNNELVIVPAREHFKEYALIVLRFNDQLAAWRNEMDGQDYRVLAENLDQHRTNIHNFCLSDIKILNRLAEKKQQVPFAASSKANPDRTDYGQAIVKYCCERVSKIITSYK
ncbi:DUF3232 domain-containing protein [Lactobacillus sp. UMNPBX4]|jgi:hypothetical protein|uniref:DUF3232 domain-containing protein n=1 Tax=Lactobacillus sp. UMNPBX4 TaxID=2042043 RepID=UPI000BEF0C3A|nr:DUF3232 domain-containing protein [Lactobacillus sp. UMNPBX4]PEH06125.1 hypothetical protein CP355_05780 [Lactobacillus sp. UMNPBX4]